jgi:hypothetical protein
MGMGIFISVITILVIFNAGCYMVNPVSYPLLDINTFISYIVSVVAIACIVGISALTFSLSDNAQRLIFVSLGLIDLLFQIKLSLPDIPGYNFPTVPLGLGLISTPFSIFMVSDFLHIGLIVTLVLGVLSIVSGLEMAMGVSD